jgi:glycerol uptake facilitator-like aquaporin
MSVLNAALAKCANAAPIVPKLLMEFTGTFFLCAVIAHVASNEAGLHAEFAPFAIGLTLMVFVYAGAHVSGANYNPAVSLALCMRGALPFIDMIMCVRLAAVSSQSYRSCH